MASLTNQARKIYATLAEKGRERLGAFRRQTAPDNAREQAAYDRRLVYSLSKSRIPTLRQLKYIGQYLSQGEKWILRTSFSVIFISVFYVGANFYFDNLKVVPVAGGVYTEGLIGSLKYANPLYSGASDVDNDIASLVYSSLFRRGTDGRLSEDLVESYSLSEDNREYVFSLRTGATWHNGARLTADDVLFTINAIQDQQYKSPLKSSLAGVKAERLGDYSFKLALADPYAAFLEILTFGILPADLWAQIPPDSALLAELNVKPIGSGPYKFGSLAKDKSGNIQKYDLKRNEDYYGRQPLVDLSFVFFRDFTEAIAALNANGVDGISYLPPDLKEQVLTPKAFHFHDLYLPQLTVVFFNQERNPALGEKPVRQALAAAIDRTEIISGLLGGSARPADGPILADSFAYNPAAPRQTYDKAKAEQLLDEAGWKTAEISREGLEAALSNLEAEDEAARRAAETAAQMGEGRWRMKNGAYLAIELKTVERKENQQVLERIKAYWEAAGVKTFIEAVPIARISGEVIKERQFDALFYGQVMGADPDPYAFWHSSQTGENGFNIANFTDKEADELLENARLASDQGERQKAYFRFQEIIAAEVPAVFMYSPLYTYIQTNRIKGFSTTNIYVPKDRFSGVSGWYLKTAKRLILDSGS